MEARLAKFEARVKELEREKGVGEVRLFDAAACPSGWEEWNATKGYMLVSRPEGSKTGTLLNRPLESGETDRSPEHSHAASVTDAGHSHASAIHDPGHAHKLIIHDGNIGTPWMLGGAAAAGTQEVSTQKAFTNISLSNAPAKSNIEVTMEANEGGEGYPLVYVLLCRRL